jgi:hypothetical protein
MNTQGHSSSRLADAKVNTPESVAIEQAVIDSLDHSVTVQSIELQQALNSKRFDALAAQKRKAPKVWGAVICSLSVAWVASLYLVQDSNELDVEMVSLDSGERVLAMVQEVPQIDLEALEHTDFLLWMAESSGDLPST